MRRFLSALCILIVLVSCTLGNQEPDVVRIQFSDSTPKLIGYDGSLSQDGSVSIDTYRVGITDPQGTSTYSEWLSDTGYYEISGLIIGDTYTFTVDGAISMASGEPAIISTEAVPHKVVSGTDTVIITLDEFVQAEATSLTVTITPPEDAIGTITYTGVLAAPDGTGEIARTSTTSTTLTFDASTHDLTAGVYLLTVTADDGTDSWKAADAVRLLPNLPATGSISFIAQGAVDSDITIDDQTGHIIRFVRPDGTSPADEDTSSWIGGTVTIDLSDTDAAGSTYRVFVNGTELASTEWAVASDVITLSPTEAMGFIDGRNVVTIFADNGTLFGKGSMDFGVEIGEVVKTFSFVDSDSSNFVPDEYDFSYEDSFVTDFDQVNNAEVVYSFGEYAPQSKAPGRLMGTLGFAYNGDKTYRVRNVNIQVEDPTCSGFEAQYVTLNDGYEFGKNTIVCIWTGNADGSAGGVTVSFTITSVS